MIGPGKYDEELEVVLNIVGAREGLLLVLDGIKGPGFSGRLSKESSLKMTTILKKVIEQIEEDNKELGFTETK